MRILYFCPVVSFLLLLLRFLANLSRRRLDVLSYFHTWYGLSANLECRSEMYCTRFAGNAGRKKIAVSAPLQTLSGYIFATTAPGMYRQSEKPVKQQYLLHMSSQYGELRPTNSWDRFGSLRHPCKFQLVSRRGSVTARHSSSGSQPNFARLNRGRQLYSAGQPSRCALAHILVVTRMWANAQPDGRPTEHRWRPLFNAGKFGWRPLLDAVQ